MKTLKKLGFLAVCMLSLLVTPALSAILFSDGFETGNLTNWNTPGEGDANCHVTADTTVARTGTYSGKTDDASSTAYEACLVKSLPGSTPLYIQYYVYFPSGFFTALGTSTREILRIFSTGTGYVYLSMTSATGLTILESVGYANASYSGPALAEDSWHSIEIMVPACTAGATIEWWVNDVAQSSITNADLSGFTSWNTVYIGLHWCSSDTILQTCYIDDMSIGDAYIGAAGPGNLQFSAATYNENENVGSATITVQRSGGSEGVVSVEYATANGSAVAGSDYTAASGTLNWSDTDSSDKTFTIAITNDSDSENSETIDLTLSNATGGASLGSPSSATFTITDDDNSGALQFTASSYNASEGAGSVTITVSRTGSSGAVSVQYATSNGTANAGSDYTSASGTLNWPDSDTANKTFTVVITDDTDLESAETVSLTLTNATGGAVLGIPDSATLTITDNDTPPPTNTEYVWLHVDGKYIKRSPYCDRPNEIWMGAGMCVYNQSTGGWATADPEIADYLDLHGINHVRFSLNSYLPEGEDGTDWPYAQFPTSAFASAQAFIDAYMDSVVQLYADRGIYMYLDEHYYMHDTGGAHGNPMDVDNPTQWTQRWLDDWAYFANYYKDEPWIMGYELINEPANIDGAQCRRNYMKCIENIREVDQKHIILVGSNWYSHMSGHDDTWEIGLPENEKYRPDPGYDNVIFTFHEYCNAAELYSSVGGQVNDEMGRIQHTYNVPFICTEFGPIENGGGCNFDYPGGSIRRFEMEMMEMCYGDPGFWNGAPVPDPAYPSRGTPAPFRCGWTLFFCHGGLSYARTISEWEDIWFYAVAQQGSVPPQPGMAGDAEQVICTANYAAIPANGTSLCTITATIADSIGMTVSTWTTPVTFTISGQATWEDGTTTEKIVPNIYGMATIKIKSSLEGTATVSAASGGLTPDSADVIITGGAIRVALTANPLTLSADGTSTSFITATLRDSLGNLDSTITSGRFTFTVDGPGTLFTDASTQGTTRDISTVPGTVYMIVKAGDTAGNAVVTGNFPGMLSGSVTIGIGQSPEIKVNHPNPYSINDGGSLNFNISGIEGACELKIYTVSGRLVKKFEIAEGIDQVNWDLLNEEGSGIKKGLYLYGLSDSNGNRQTGKVVIGN